MLKQSLVSMVMAPAKDHVRQKRKAAVVQMGPNLALSFCEMEESWRTSCTTVAVSGKTDLKKTQIHSFEFELFGKSKVYLYILNTTSLPIQQGLTESYINIHCNLTHAHFSNSILQLTSKSFVFSKFSLLINHWPPVIFFMLSSISLPLTLSKLIPSYS